MSMWVPGDLADTWKMWEGGKQQLIAACFARFGEVLHRAAEYGMAQGVLDGPFPLDGSLEDAGRWLLAFETLKASDVFHPLLPYWDHLGLRRDGYHRNHAQGASVDAESCGLIWWWEVFDCGMASWGLKHAEGVQLEIFMGDLRCWRHRQWETVGKRGIGTIHTEQTVYANFVSWRDHSRPWSFYMTPALKDQGIPLWFPEWVVPNGEDFSSELFHLSVFRDDDVVWNWGVQVDVESLSEDIDDVQGQVVEVLAREIGLLEKVKEVVQDDDGLIMVSAKGWRSPVSDLRKIIKRVGGGLAGLKVDPDVEDNR